MKTTQNFPNFAYFQRLAVGVNNPWDYKTWDDHNTHHDKWSQYPDHHRSSGPVCGLDPA